MSLADLFVHIIHTHTWRYREHFLVFKGQPEAYVVNRVFQIM